jgi:hypothetical protein
MAQVSEHLSSKFETLSSNSSEKPPLNLVGLDVQREGGLEFCILVS